MTKAASAPASSRSGSKRQAKSAGKAELLRKVTGNLTAFSVAELRTIEKYVAKIAAHPERTVFSAYIPNDAALRAAVTVRTADGTTFIARVRPGVGRITVVEPSRKPPTKIVSARGPAVRAEVKPRTALERARAKYETFRREIVARSLSLTQAAKRMDLTTEGLSIRVDRGEMVAFKDGNRKMVPLELMDDEQPTRTVRGLSEVVRAANAAQMEPFRLVAWLLSPSRTLGERRPVDELRTGNVAKVVRAVESLGAT